MSTANAQKTDDKGGAKPEGAKPDAAKPGAAKPGAGATATLPAAKSSPLPLIAAAAGALALGSVLGIFVVAPKIVAGRGATHANAADHGNVGKPGGKGKDEKPSEAVVHKIENLIVNPAGSQGRRFLMMSVAIQVPDAKTDEKLRAQDPMLRDAIIGAVQGQPFEVITSPGGRDSVRAAITRVVKPMVPDAEFVRVYLPQFVLQ